MTMEVTELNRISLPEHIQVSNCCVWSEDNTVAIIGIKGVFIVGFVSDFLSNKKTLKVYGRTRINISHNFPACNVDKMVPTVDDGEKFQMLMNGMLNPQVDNVVSVHQIRWSPKFINSCSCILGILSNHGSLELLIKDVMNWTGVFDIGVEWRKHQMDLWNKNDSSTAFSRNLFYERFKQLRIVAFTWTHNIVIQEKLHSVLIAGHNDGELTVWTLKEDPALTVSFTNSVNSGLNTRLQSLHWYPISSNTGWLIITTIDGIVNLYSCSWDKDYTFLSVHYLSTIWSDIDHIIVTNVLLKSRPDDVMFVMSKERSVVVMLLSRMGIILQQTFYRTTDFRVTGLDIINDNQIFVLLVGGLYYLLNVKEALKDSPKELKPGKGLTLTREDMPGHSNYTADESFTYGAAVSPNKMFFTILAGVPGPYQGKDYSSLVLCSLYRDVAYPLRVIRSLLHKNSFFNMQDCFEIIRVYLTEDFISSYDYDLLDECNPFTNFEIQSTKTAIQLFYWFFKILKNKNITCTYTKEYDLDKLEIMMVMSNIFTYFRNVTCVRQQYLIREWIAANVSKLPETRQDLVNTATEMVYRFSDARHVESCVVCSSKITVLDQIRYVKCNQNHVTLRCTHSLIPIGINHSRICPSCSSVVLESENVFQCVFCDGLLCKRPK